MYYSFYSAQINPSLSRAPLVNKSHEELKMQGNLELNKILFSKCFKNEYGAINQFLYNLSWLFNLHSFEYSPKSIQNYIANNPNSAESLVFKSAEIKLKETLNNFFHLVKQGQIKEVENILRQGEININSTNERGLTPLSLAYSEGHGDMVDFLKNMGAVENKVEIDIPVVSQKESYLNMYLFMSGNGDKLLPARNVNQSSIYIVHNHNDRKTLII